MTGIGTQLAIAEMALRQWRQDGTVSIDDAELPYFRLGAISGSLTEFLSSRPDDVGGRGSAPVFAVWLPILRLLADVRAADGTLTPGVVANFVQLTSVFTRYRQAVADEDKWALLDMLPELQALQATSDALRAQVASVTGLRTAVGLAAFLVQPARKTDPVSDWALRDVLHGHSTGRFWGELSRRAIGSGDARLRAFGLGITVAQAGALAGNPFGNSIVGGPYRNHWWRHHWVRHHIDTWAWGYQATREDERAQGREIVFEVNGTTPFPRLNTWRDIAGADVQDSFAIGGVDPTTILAAVTDSTPLPAFLPNELAQLWIDVHHDIIDDPAASGLDPQAVQSAYAMAWFTTWLSSSGTVLGATPPDRINEPDACGDRPAWAAPDGSVLVGATTVSPPTPSTPSPSAAQIASAIIAALLGAVAFFTGNIVAGIAAIAGAVAIIDDATDPDWDELRCHAGWVNVYLQSLENALREMLVAAGLAHPFATTLRHDPATFSFSGVAEPLGAALNTCRTRDDREYPRSVWTPLVTSNGVQSTWMTYPTEPGEVPRTNAYPSGPWWPNHLLDGWSFTRVTAPDGTVAFSSTQDNPLTIAPSGAPLVSDTETWKQRRETLSDPVFAENGFGNAVDLATALVRQGPADWLDWDLDGDRGLLWPTWMQVPGGSPSAVIPE